MKEVFDSVAFVAGGRHYLWREVVSAPMNIERWSALRERARENLNWLAYADGLDEDIIPGSDLERAMDEFRYARDLVAAEEMANWLAGWGLDTEDWIGFLRARLLREQTPALSPPQEGEFDPGEAGLDRAQLAEAVFGGEFFEMRGQLAAHVAVFERARQKGSLPLPPGPAAPSFAEMEREFGAFRAQVVTDEFVRSRIRMRRADWTHLACRKLQTPRAEVAREALLSVREDGLSLDEVAAEAGLEAVDVEALLVEFPAVLRDLLQGARPGELVGPIAVDGEFAVVLVVERVPADPEDTGLQERARQELFHEALRREVDDRVSWR